MSEYTSFDFTESLNRVNIPIEDITFVLYAWGKQGDFAEWSGGFVMKLDDGRYCIVTGWCDTTGWGCQDGANVEYFDTQPPPPEEDHDDSPTDLNMVLPVYNDILGKA